MLYLALILGVIVGLVMGALGGGGSILAVPLLTYALGLEPRAAIAGSLLVVGVGALPGLVLHARAGHVRGWIGLGFGALGLAGSLAGSQLAKLLDERVQLVLFSVILFAAAWLLLRRNKRDVEETYPPAGPLLVGAAGLGTGVLTGLVGVGGGFMIVPALALVAGLRFREAVGTSLLVISLNAVGGFSGYASYVELDLTRVLPLLAGALLGTGLGAAIAHRIPADRLRRAFAYGLLILATLMLTKELWGLLA